MTDRALLILTLLVFVCILAGQWIPTLIGLCALAVVVFVEVVWREPVTVGLAQQLEED